MRMANNWHRVPVSKTYLGLYDGPHATPKPSDDGPIFLGIGNLTEDGHLDLSNIRHIAENDYSKWTKRVEPKPGDIVFTYEATLNRYAIIPEGFKGCLGRRLALIRPNPAVVDTRFLHFCFFGEDWRATIAANILAGATVERIPLTRFPDFPICLPPLGVQRRIAFILSAYDDLIENNTRRIAILEEMARRIYEEWFVRFRFPGHEGVRMVESELGLVPKSWVQTNLKAVCTSKDGIQTGPFGSQLHKADYSIEGVPVLMPKDLIDFRIQTNTIARISEEKANQLARHRMRPGDIAYGRRGDIGRRAYIMAHQAGWFCGTGCLRIRPDPARINGWYLFNFIGQESMVGLISGRAHGATMPNLNARLMESIPVICPPRELQNQFEHVTFAMFELREKLIAKNQNLTTTRDLLLPKLISGELDVSEPPAPEALAA